MISINQNMQKNESYSLVQGGGSKEHSLPSTPKPEDLLDTDNMFKLIDLYFKQKNIMYSHLYNSFDKFIDDDVRTLLEKGNNVFYEHVTNEKVYRYKFEYADISLKPPIIENDDDIMYPEKARERNLTYAAKLVATITQIQEIVDIATDTITRKVVGTPEYQYPIAIIPIMVRSKYCSLNIIKDNKHRECKFDPGGYFIVNGSEKVVISLERMCDNKPFVSTKKDSSSLIYSVQVNSRSNKINDLIQIITIRMKKDRIMTIRVPLLAEVPVFILFRALGIESERDIINCVAYDENDTEMINLIRVSLENSISETTSNKIMTQEEAMNYLINKMRLVKKYSETDKDVRIQEKKMHLLYQLKNTFLPHVENNLLTKGYFLGYMINRLLNCYLGRITVDDRDSYINKRVDLPGNLMFELFKQYYKKMMNECGKSFQKRTPDDNNPLNIIFKKDSDLDMEKNSSSLNIKTSIFGNLKKENNT
jgi:DNA-directed RNA polymerase II subunit RPB2